MAQTKALQVITPSTGVMTSVSTPPIKELMGSYLRECKFSPEDLILDLCVEMTRNPRLQECTPGSLQNTLLYAARNRSTFGQYGIWVIPRKDKDRGWEAHPQMGYKRKAAETKKVTGIPTTKGVVFKGEPFEIIYDDGVAVGVNHQPDLSRENAKMDDVYCAYGIASYPDGRRFVLILSKHDILRAYAMRATKEGGIWVAHLVPQIKKTVDHRMGELIVGDFSAGSGGPAESFIPASAYEQPYMEAQYENIPPDASLADTLEKRDQPPPPEKKPEPKARDTKAPPKDTSPPPPPPPAPAAAVEIPALPNSWEDKCLADPMMGDMEKKFSFALNNLETNPEGIAEMWGENNKTWGTHNDLHFFTAFKRHYYALAASKGFPQPD